MRADSHVGPEHNAPLTEVLYIVAALTFVDLGMPPCYARPGHTLWHFSDLLITPYEVRLPTQSGDCRGHGQGARDGEEDAAKGDTEGADTWLRIIVAIGELGFFLIAPTMAAGVVRWWILGWHLGSPFLSRVGHRA